MYASIQRYDNVTALPDELMPAGRRHAAALQRVPGFVAYLLLDAGDGQLMAVSLFEDEADLLAAERVPALDEWLQAERTPPAAGQPRVTRGEVVVQKGL